MRSIMKCNEEEKRIAKILDVIGICHVMGLRLSESRALVLFFEFFAPRFLLPLTSQC